jgi:hypothetical protein
MPAVVEAALQTRLSGTAPQNIPLWDPFGTDLLFLTSE